MSKVPTCWWTTTSSLRIDGFVASTVVLSRCASLGCGVVLGVLTLGASASISIQALGW